ncbi:MAG: uracil-DNA glycosylase family protein [Pseudomonadota bacterium]|nr:uracil-DNA glycosylase family protein [Pseudomonadota bacterium]
MEPFRTSAQPDVVACRDCSRLVNHQAYLKRLHPDYWCAPVPCWGVSRPRLMIIGLAPGRAGAGRTGKGFVGDASGAFLFESLHRHGFATDYRSEQASLRGAVITNIVKCVPPGNRPLSREKRNCEKFLARELESFLPNRRTKNRVILCLGRDAYESLHRLLELPAMPFAHDLRLRIRDHVFMLSSLHPSRLNVNTGRLTQAMLDSVVAHARSLLVR